MSHAQFHVPQRQAVGDVKQLPQRPSDSRGLWCGSLFLYG